VSSIEGPDRAQINLPPSSIEDYIAPEALVRVVDAFEAFAFGEGDRSLQNWRDAHSGRFCIFSRGPLLYAPGCRFGQRRPCSRAGKKGSLK
jgi:hypothetical protein